ncbi:MAG: ABC transporter permease subunit [Cryomorphaceae bacterium]|nr:ABC transporter permease subunit [Cryomorphaceae bacterium]
MKVNDSPVRQAIKRFKQNVPALAGVLFIVFLILIALGGAAIRPDNSRDANNQNLSIARQKPGFKVDVILFSDGSEVPISHIEQTGEVTLYTPFGDASARAISANDADFKVEHRRYLLGTDKYGRDLLSRLMAGTGLSLSVGFIAVLISLLLGIVLGACAGYFGGKTDAVISWVINVVWSIPTLLMVIAITLAFGKGFWQVFVAVGLTMWVEVARVVRGQFLSIREKEYVEAAKMLGLSNFRIMFRHILPNASGPIIVISAANFASAILIEAGLSFLGIGAQIPTPSWGNMIKEHYALITTDLAYLAILPGLLIMLLVLSFMMIGNGLRDALDVRS